MGFCVLAFSDYFRFQLFFDRRGNGSSLVRLRTLQLDADEAPLKDAVPAEAEDVFVAPASL